MKTFTIRAGLVAMALSGFLVAAGCNPSADTGGAGKAEGTGKEKPPVAKAKKDDHSDWWCAEHGVPEDECSMCSPKVAKAFKEKGDWCEKHDRARSQCFICDPSLKEKYAARYRAKYGKEPPPTEDEEEKKDDKDAKKDEPKKDPKDGKKEETK
jgi:hypothetical protein